MAKNYGVRSRIKKTEARSRSKRRGLITGSSKAFRSAWMNQVGGVQQL
jgi:hypothetical protein